MTSERFAALAGRIAGEEETVYMKGVFGAPVTPSLLSEKAKQYPSWYTAARLEALRGKEGAFGFDCVCLLKGLLWGWNGDPDDKRGGAVYRADGIPDFTVEALPSLCTSVSSDFSRIETGEILWMKGHCGIYLGGGVAVECTTKWDGGVQKSFVLTAPVPNVKGRVWEKHGKLKFLAYPLSEDRVSLSLPILQKGSKRSEVRAMQFLLNGDGASLETDASFGAKTDRALRDFQKKRGIPENGTCGEKTWRALLGTE